jgi:CDP-glycerol glycerophosphotransferase (TagB/SpsB family)
VRSTYAVAGTRLWGDQRPVYFGVSPEGVLVTGHPRVDQFARPPDGAALRRLGLNPDKPLVLWMPTYRSSEYRGRRLAAMRHGSDARDLSEQTAVVDLGRQVARLADRMGVTVVVKPHPLDIDEYADLGLPIVDSEDLRREHLTVYQFMGASAGLITDYSSVWTDYLATDRPVGVFCPDLEEYEGMRGLNVPDYLAIIPGPRLESLADFEAFLRECRAQSGESRAVRVRSAQAIGAETRLGATDRLLDAVGVPRPLPPVAATPEPAPPVPAPRIPRQRAPHYDSTSTSAPSRGAVEGR